MSVHGSDGTDGTDDAATDSDGAATDDTGRPRRTSLRDRVTRVLLLAAVAVGLVFALEGQDLSGLWSALAAADPGFLAVAALANVASQATRALGWNVILTGQRIGFARLVRLEFAVQAAAAVSPEGAGEFLRVGYLSREGVPRVVTVTLMLVRKYFSSLGLVPFLVAVWWPGSGVPTWGVVVAGVYVAVLTVGTLLILAVSRAPTEPVRATRWRRIVYEARTALGPVRRPRAVNEVAGAAVLTRALDLAALLTVAHALDLDLPWAAAVLVVLSIEVSNLLPTAPAQVGTFEAAVLIATAGTLGQVEGLTLALVFHAQQILPQIPLGMIAMAGSSIVRDHLKTEVIDDGTMEYRRSGSRPASVGSTHSGQGAEIRLAGGAHTDTGGTSDG